MTKDEALKLALEALQSGDYWKGVEAVNAIREALASPVATNDTSEERVDETVKQRHEPEPDKNGSPCPEFWDWLPKAYNFVGDGNFTKYNMEVAFLAGKQSVPTQEPVAWINWCAATGKRSVSFECESELASEPLYAGITQNTQDHYSKFHSWFDSELHRKKYTQDHPAYLAAQEAWNAANDAAQHRINHLNAEIEAWKVRFKIAEDALAKLNGPEQKPVATLWQHGETGRTRITMPDDITDCDARWFKAADLYTTPSHRKPLKIEELPAMRDGDHAFFAGVRFAEAAHGIKE